MYNINKIYDKYTNYYYAHYNSNNNKFLYRSETVSQSDMCTFYKYIYTHTYKFIHNIKYIYTGIYINIDIY